MCRVRLPANLFLKSSGHCLHNTSLVWLLKGSAMHTACLLTLKWPLWQVWKRHFKMLRVLRGMQDWVPLMFDPEWAWHFRQRTAALQISLILIKGNRHCQRGQHLCGSLNIDSKVKFKGMKYRCPLCVDFRNFVYLALQYVQQRASFFDRYNLQYDCPFVCTCCCNQTYCIKQFVRRGFSLSAQCTVCGLEKRRSKWPNFTSQLN